MAEESNFKTLSADEVMARQQANPDLLLLDVRTPDEWEEYRIPGAVLIPMHQLPSRIGELSPERETVVVCEHGIRSQQAAQFLAAQAGFTNVANLEGGMSAWNGPVETD